MKSIFTYLLLALLIATGPQMLGQLVIDLSTGVNSAGQPLPTGTTDPKWTVTYPTDPINTFNPLYCGSGMRNPGNVQYPPTTGTYAGIKWVTPYIDGNGNHLSSTNGPYTYKMNFNLFTCPIQAATINLQRIGGDDIIQYVTVNGHLYNTAGATPPGTFGSITIPLTISHLVQGTNEITIWIPTGTGYTGLEIKGNLTIQTCGAVVYDLTDKAGVAKNEFCISEDVIFTAGLNSPGFLPGSYNIELLKTTGSSVASLGSQAVTGFPNALNVTDAFAAALQNPDISAIYTIKVSINGLCNPLQTQKNFKFRCCGAPDPSFSLSANGFLSGSSPVRGNHTWTIYNTLKANEGPYTRIAILRDQKIGLYTGGPCYYITHNVSNACGNKCAAQSVCNSECSAIECILTKPVNLKINQKGNLLSWDAVTGVGSYIVEVILNERACCSNGGPSPFPTVISFPVQSNSHALTLSDLGLPRGSDIRCFAWRVYAVCPDGSRSEASDFHCSY